jgi:lysozyme family protein
MADSSKLVPFILSWETDKYTNNKKDKGGPTKYGITLATWRKVGYDKNGDGVLNEEDVKPSETTEESYRWNLQDKRRARLYETMPLR